MPHFEVELGRNRSLPDIKPFSSDDHRTPARGSSLTNPRTNPGPFRSRQKPQNQFSDHHNHHQIASAMSNEPITAMTTTSDIPGGSLQDAYGGTTDDWRQAQQAEQEARERQKLKDSSPTDRTGHMSINSVSTLNLPPSNPTVTPPQTSSMSRILLPDRDRFHNKNISHTLNSGGPNSASLQSHGQFVEEPTQENTSLAMATTQPGGILSQLQAATEKGQVIDPITTVWSQKEGAYIQRSKTAPYPLRENRTIAEEEAESLAGSGQRGFGPLEYSKSEGYGAAATRRDRQQKRVQPPQGQQQLPEEEEQEHQQSCNQRQQAGRPSMDQHIDLRTEPLNIRYQRGDQEPQHISRSRAMSHESAVDTNKDLPPTPFRVPTPPGQVSSDASSCQQQDRQQQKGQRLRSDSQSEASRNQHYQHQQQRPSARSAGGNGPITSEESVLTLSRSMSPPPHRRVSHERNGSFGHLNLNLTRGASTAGQQHHHHHQGNGGSTINSGVHKEHVQYGIDMLPLPLIPSPDESLKKNANLGILPQDVLKTMDPTTVQKVITVSVIASRVYKVLALEEVESLRKVIRFLSDSVAI